MRAAVFKNIVREIWATKARFLSILAIIALGVGLFVGIKASGPSMVNTLVNYAHEQNMMDFRLLSSVGFSQEDVEQFENTEGVSQVQSGYYADVIMNDGDKKSVVRLHSLDENDELNKPVLVEGRLPQAADEIVVEDTNYNGSLEIGERITFDKTVSYGSSGEQDVPLEGLEYTVVGKIKSPLYISFQKGSTTVGNGTISYYMMVSPKAFTSERFTEVYVLSDYSAQGGYPLNDEYTQEMDKLETRLQAECDEALERFDTDELEPKRLEIADGREELEQARAEAQGELDTSLEQIEALETQYNEQIVPSGNEALIAQVGEQLESAREEYETAKTQADESFAEQEEKLDNAEEELAEFDKLSSYVFTRDDSSGYAEYKDNADRVDAVAAVFPVFFLLVAALVCVTTMTRMVEERRTEIGIFKALGYSNGTIISKYVTYSTIAGVLGCVIGAVAGLLTLPYIIFKAYGMMYHMKAMDPIIPWECIVAGFIAAVLCTSIVSWLTCRGELIQRPAALMRPKAPKAGKRNLLERITPLWKRLGFTSKVTIRNIFRYKARFFMTVIGVAGCTALVLTGFGLRDAISAIVDKQFGEIYGYNLSIVFSESKSAAQAEEFVDDMKSDYDLQATMPVMQEEIKTVDDGGAEHGDVYIVVPKDPENLRDIIDLHNRQSGENIELDSSGCVMSEKLAANMGLEPGDEFTVENSDGERCELELSAICENYLYNYLYMTPEYYSDSFNEEVEYNMIDTQYSYTTEDERDELAQTLLELDGIASVTYTDSGIENFNTMLDTLNKVVYVMILAAGALAFVVLYNLTNINIAERAREIATIKVLGFYNREVSEYIYRENIILTIVGGLVGLGLGVLLNSYVVQTVEIDIVMFGREIYLPSYLYAIGITFIFAIIVNVLMYFKMRKIDMVESLKSIE